MRLCQLLPCHLRHQQALRMPTLSQLKPAVVVSVWRLHVDILRFLPLRILRRRISLDKVRQPHPAPVHNLTPSLDAFELRHKFLPWQSSNILHRQQQARRPFLQRRVAQPSLLLPSKRLLSLRRVHLFKRLLKRWRHLRILRLGRDLRIVPGVSRFLRRVSVLPLRHIVDILWKAFRAGQANHLQPIPRRQQILLQSIVPVDAQILRLAHVICRRRATLIKQLT